MAAARISPAASLLRNSKLFAIPPTIALPAAEPSSEPIPRSDTATSIYPTQAAIETNGASLFRGDWGLKRPLPLKSTVKSRVVRLNNGIDTREHIADFDSAADHVLTLKKFQQLNLAIQFPGSKANTAQHDGVFERTNDNTDRIASSSAHNTTYTGVWPNVDPTTIPMQLPKSVARRYQAPVEKESLDPLSDAQRLPEQKRWRFDGPSLVQMSAFEFDEYLQSIDSNKRSAFRRLVQQYMQRKREEGARAAARDRGTIGEEKQELDISEEQVTEYIRLLRQQPGQFGPLIAEFLDLPDGPTGANVTDNSGKPRWLYRSGLLPSEYYQEAGPPRTHPSAGLSYIHNQRSVENHALFGPLQERSPVVARVIKTRQRGNKKLGNYGVAGLVVQPPGAAKGGRTADIPAFEPVDGGLKMTVIPTEVEITEQGTVRMTVKHINGYAVQDEKAIHNSLTRQEETVAVQATQTRIMPSLTQDKSNYRRREEEVKSDQQLDDFLADMERDAGGNPSLRKAL